MKSTVFAIAVAALSLAAVSGIAQAAPIAPMASGVTVGHGNLTQVQYWWHRHHRRCWVGRYGHMHCRWW